MIVKAWFIVAVMSGVYTDGTKDIFIFQNPPDHGHFHSSFMCQKFIGDHPFKLARALIKQYGNRPPERLCVCLKKLKIVYARGWQTRRTNLVLYEPTCEVCGSFVEDDRRAGKQVRILVTMVTG